MNARALMQLVLLAGLVASGCTVTWNAEAELYVRPRSYVQVTSACPPLKEEEDGRYERPSRPDVNAIWVSGHWTWEGGWVWARGRWVVPRPGYEWEPPVCVARDGDYRLYPGYFRGRAEEPLPVYREPGHIRVHRPSDADERLPDRVVVRPGSEPPRDTGGSGTVRVDTRPRDDSSAPSDGRGQTGSADTDVRPASEGRGQTGSADTSVRPASEGRGQTGSAATAVRDPSEGGGETGDGQGPGPLECSITVRRMPAGGRVTITGTGFTEGVQVRIAGNIAEIRRRTTTEISAVANHAGTVRVIRGEERADCGRISLIQR